MVRKTLKVRNGALTLREELPKTWKNADVYVAVEENAIFLRRLRRPASLAELRPVFKALGKKLSKKNIETAIRAVRSQSRARRT